MCFEAETEGSNDVWPPQAANKNPVRASVIHFRICTRHVSHNVQQVVETFPQTLLALHCDETEEEESCVSVPGAVERT